MKVALLDLIGYGVGNYLQGSELMQTDVIVCIIPKGSTDKRWLAKLNFNEGRCKSEKCFEISRSKESSCTVDMRIHTEA